MDDELIPVETEKPPKERVKLTHSFWAKVGAVVLLYVFLLCSKRGRLGRRRICPKICDQ